MRMQAHLLKSNKSQASQLWQVYIAWAKSSCPKHGKTDAYSCVRLVRPVVTGARACYITEKKVTDLSSPQQRRTASRRHARAQSGTDRFLCSILFMTPDWPAHHGFYVKKSGWCAWSSFSSIPLGVAYLSCSNRLRCLAITSPHHLKWHSFIGYFQSYLMPRVYIHQQQTHTGTSTSSQQTPVLCPSSFAIEVLWQSIDIGLDPDNFVDLVWSCPKLMTKSGKSSWPQKLLLGNQNVANLNASLTLLFIKVISLFGSGWEKTLFDGKPKVIITQTRPGLVHFRDIVLYRIVQQGLLENGLNMRILADPEIAKVDQSCDEAAHSDVGLLQEQKRQLSYCANPRCMILDFHLILCSGCRVSQLLRRFRLKVHWDGSPCSCNAQVAYYCSRECGEKDWDMQHFHECQQLQGQQQLARMKPWH